jgi:hypothetical protein
VRVADVSREELDEPHARPIAGGVDEGKGGGFSQAEGDEVVHDFTKSI